MTAASAQASRDRWRGRGPATQRLTQRIAAANERGERASEPPTGGGGGAPPQIRKEERFMLSRTSRFIALAVLILAPALLAQVPSASDPPKYALPPQNIIAVFDAEPLPQTLLSPNRQVVALTKARAYPTIAELSQPMLRLAGLRVNPKTHGPHRASGLPGTGIYSIALKKIADGAELNVTMPAQARISNVKFSPDGSRLAFLQTKDSAIELWIADGATGAAKAVASGADRINATAG